MNQYADDWISINKVRAINRRRFGKALQHVLVTKPVVTGSDRFAVLSMVHHRDVESYLLAIKSFCRFLHPQRIIVVSDPSITEADQSLIRSHVHGIEFAKAVDFREPGNAAGRMLGTVDSDFRVCAK